MKRGILEFEREQRKFYIVRIFDLIVIFQYDIVSSGVSTKYTRLPI